MAKYWIPNSHQREKLRFSTQNSKLIISCVCSEAGRLGVEEIEMHYILTELYDEFINQTLQSPKVIHPSLIDLLLSSLETLVKSIGEMQCFMQSLRQNTLRTRPCH